MTNESTCDGSFVGFFLTKTKENHSLAQPTSSAILFLGDMKGLTQGHHKMRLVRDVVMETDASLLGGTFRLSNTGTEFQFYI